MKGGLKESWTGPNPGWIQYCDNVEVDEDGFVAKIGGEPLDLEVDIKQLYNSRVITYIIQCTIESLQSGIFHRF